MPFNAPTFRTRTISAIIFAVIMLVGLLWNFWSFFILFSIIHFGCWIEYQKLIGLIDKEYAQISPFHKYGIMITGWCIMFYFSNGYTIFSVPMHLIGQWVGLALLIALPLLEVIFVRNISFKLIGFSLLGLIYISLSWGLLTDIRSKLPDDAVGDFVGKFIGKTPFSKISPKKTWEGTIGGIILAIIVMGITGGIITGEFDLSKIYMWLIVPAIASIVGTIGDLLESKLKRLANVKDSGRILPGHGGFLDRFDSLLLATPFVWLYLISFLRA